MDFFKLKWNVFNSNNFFLIKWIFLIETKCFLFKQKEL